MLINLKARSNASQLIAGTRWPQANPTTASTTWPAGYIYRVRLCRVYSGILVPGTGCLALSPTRYCIRDSLGLVWKPSTGGSCARLQYVEVALPFCVATIAIPYCNTAFTQSKNLSRQKDGVGVSRNSRTQAVFRLCLQQSALPRKGFWFPPQQFSPALSLSFRIQIMLERGASRREYHTHAACAKTHPTANAGDCDDLQDPLNDTHA